MQVVTLRLLSGQIWYALTAPQVSDLVPVLESDLVSGKLRINF